MINKTLIKVKSVADFITFAKANAGFVILGQQHEFIAAWSAVTLHPAFEIVLHGNTLVVATTFENKYFEGRQHGFEAVNISASRLKDLLGCLFAFGEGHVSGNRPAESKDFTLCCHVSNLAWFKPTPLQNLTQILNNGTLRDDVDVRYYEGVEKILTMGEL